MKQISISESFSWAQQLWPILKQFENDGVSYYQVVANHSDVKNRNGRVYTDEELRQAASSLSERPLNINHNSSKTLPFPENEVLVARYENGTVECIIQVADPKTNQMIKDGQIQTVSIEGSYLDGSKNTRDTEYPTSLHFQALALLTNDDTPSDPQARILREHFENVGNSEFWMPASITDQVLRYGDIISMKSHTVTESIDTNANASLVIDEAEWSTKIVNDFPDSCFAYISPGGSKDSEGKTVPRTLRHLPYKGADGKPDPAHVRDALSRLPQTDIPDEAKAEANRKLQAAAKELGIETAQMQAKEVRERLATQAVSDYANGFISKGLYVAIMKEAGFWEDSADGSNADKDAIVDPIRNEDGTFSGKASLQQNLGSVVNDNPTNQNPKDQETETNVNVGRDVQSQGVKAQPMTPLQNSPSSSVVKPDVSSTGVGNPQSTDKPTMGGKLDANPLAMTNQANVKTGEGIMVTNASSLMDALKNASTNVRIRVIPTGVSES